ncbi:MAG: MotA/TolQ/ExbB proton channel family protein [Verrucomicrobiota bacterium]
MWPILLLSIITLGSLIERAIFLISEARFANHESVQHIFNLVEHGSLDEAENYGLQCQDRIARMLTAGLVHRGISYSDAMMEQANSQLDRYNRGLVVFDTAVTLGPLLGLLGTVIGMIHAFDIVGGHDLAGKTMTITGGIAESLITVSFGLFVAIAAIIPLNYLTSRLDKARRQFESAMTRMEILLRSYSGQNQQ